jgi:hypothetical protein
MADEKAVPSRTEIVREDMRRELALDERSVGANAAAVKARAEVEAPYTIARHFPRSWLDVRTRFVNEKSGELMRPAFAKACVFAREQGGEWDRGTWVPTIVQGLSIRFAESAMALAGNIRCGSEIHFDDNEKRIYRVYAVDLETNAIGDVMIVVEKTVERKKTVYDDGNTSVDYRTVLRERKNTKGDVVAICLGTEDEITLKANNAIAKARRNLILALMPPDIKDECLEVAKRVRDAGIAKDPHAERKQLADGFAKLGVLPKDLTEYMGHELEQCSPSELGLLRGLFMAIQDGEASWPELVAEKSKPEPEQVKTSKAKKLAEEIKAKRDKPGAASNEGGKGEAKTGSGSTVGKK